MKRLFFFALLTVCSLCMRAQQVNDNVSAEHGGVWYEATILKVDPAKKEYYVKYKDWDESWNEWLTAEHIKGGTQAAPLTTYKVGDKVEVEYGMIPEPATVTEIGTNKYHIKWDNSLFGDKWVTEKQMKKL